MFQGDNGNPAFVIRKTFTRRITHYSNLQNRFQKLTLSCQLPIYRAFIASSGTKYVISFPERTILILFVARNVLNISRVDFSPFSKSPDFLSSVSVKKTAFPCLSGTRFFESSSNRTSACFDFFFLESSKLFAFLTNKSFRVLIDSFICK